MLLPNPESNSSPAAPSGLNQRTTQTPSTAKMSMTQFSMKLVAQNPNLGPPLELPLPQRLGAAVSLGTLRVVKISSTTWLVEHREENCPTGTTPKSPTSTHLKLVS